MIVLTEHLHGHLTHDAINGSQKIHRHAVPRIGGVAVFVGVICGGAVMTFGGQNLWLYFVLSCMPAFLSGLVEDLTKKVSVRARLLATVIAGAGFSLMTGYSLHHFGVPYVDNLLTWRLAALLFTGFAVGGVANAINIIDGCNGLASGTAMMLLGTFAYIAWNVDDNSLFLVILTFLGAIAGFFVMNFPRGLIFLGDAGAYSIGFLLAALAVALPARNPEVSPVIGLLVLIYPVSETLFSIARRFRAPQGKVDQPDRKHLHSLVFRALRYVVPDPTNRNSISSLLVWGLPLLSAITAASLEEAKTRTVLIAVVLNALIYVLAYRVTLSRVSSRRRGRLRHRS